MIAVIDIGSNSVRLCLWADGKTLFKRILTTRLGEGLHASARLLPEAMRRTADAVAVFRREAQEAGADKLFVFATAAVRSAKNGGEFCALVKSRCRLEVDVVSGEEEALLAANGALGEGDGAVIDVGGASTEVLLRRGGQIVFAESCKLGAVVLKDACGEDKDRLLRLIGERTQGLKALNASVTYAVGGTATTLAALKLGLTEYDGARVHGCLLTVREIYNMAERLGALDAAERQKLLATDAKRADIIVGGAYLLARAAEKTGAEAVTVSDRDNLEGYLYGKGIG